MSIPLCTSSVINQFKKFQDRVLQEDRARAAGIEASIFQKPEHLHMTIVMLKLYSEEKRHIAQETMKSLFSTVQTILAQQPLQVSRSKMTSTTSNMGDYAVMQLELLLTRIHYLPKNNRYKSL